MKKRISKHRKASINKKHLPRKPSWVFSGLRAIAQKPSPMHGSKKSFEDDQHTAQETVEYIVILAVIVVIALVVVNLLSGFTVGTQGISNAPTEIIGMTGGTISIFEAVGDYTGEALLKLQVPGQPVTLTRIATSDGSAVSYYNNQISARGSVVSYSGLNNSASNPCPQGFIGVRNTTLVFTYNTLQGQEYSQPTSVQVRCVSSSTSGAPEDVIGLGLGTLEDPWIINSCQELQNMNQHLDGNYALGADINCWETRNWNSGAGFEPIGTFTGSLDGRNKTISGLFIYRPNKDYSGLFGGIQYASIQKINLIDINITGHSNTGGLVGRIINDSTLTNVYTSGTVKSTGAYTGGIVGMMLGVNTIIDKSHSQTSVTGSDCSGGIAGWTYNGTISNSYSTGNMTTTYYNSGGLVGEIYTETKVINSYSTGSVIAGSTAGGLVGEVGYNSGGTVENSFSTGTVSGAPQGGLVGSNQGTVINSSWDITTSGRTNMCTELPPGTGCNDANGINGNPTYFYSPNNAPLSSWDFTTIWQENSGTYPTLR